jgi:hypothetical protein
MTFIHLATLLAHKNGFNEDEWSNIEFYADVEHHKLAPYTVHRLSKGGVLRPLNFKSKIVEAIATIFPDLKASKVKLLHLVYRKRTLP